MPAIETIVFDLGGVLIDWNPRYLYRQLLPDEQAVDHFLDNVTTADWNEAQDEGRSIEEGNELLIAQFPQHETLIRAFYGRWTEMLNGAFEVPLDILKQLKADGQYPLYALTNWSAETWPIALERFPFLSLFDGILVSGHEKVRKPDPAFFGLLTTRYGINLQTALFIDDNARNIAAAQALGMATIHLTAPDELPVLLSNLTGMDTAFLGTGKK